MNTPIDDSANADVSCQFQPMPMQAHWSTLAVSLARDCRQRALRQAQLVDEANPSLAIEGQDPLYSEAEG